MRRKTYNISEKTLEIINAVKDEKGLTSETAVIVFLADNYKRNQKLAKEITKEVTTAFKNDIIRLRLGVRTAERNSIVTKDLINSLLWDSESLIYMPCDGNTEHQITKEAEKRLSDMLGNLKQKRDNRAKSIESGEGNE